MRLFIAMNFDEAVKEKLADVQSRLRAAGAAGRFSLPENLHLTLVFLGEIPPGKVPAVRQAMDRTHITPLDLTFDHVGSFRREGGDIWWIGLSPHPELLRMQRELSGHLSDAGFPLESRSFTPHLTLARQVVLKQHADRAALLPSPIGARADKISLMLSERPGGRLTYTELYAKGSA